MALALAAAVLAAPVKVGAGVHRPFYPPSPAEQEVSIEAFRMDATPVTNAEFLAFAQAHPEWAKGGAPSLFADPRYLQDWAGPAALGVSTPEAPVTWVSWHAARAYCRAQGGDLPTTWQWEYAADAMADAPHGAQKDPATLRRILDWYASDAPLGAVGQDTPNYWGLYDLHGLIWEWTLDFNSVLVASDPREAGDADTLRFCGAGAVSAEDAEDYATFMRSAFRASLKAAYTTSDLGFRCAYPL
ncbi:MAG: formylglycine-generating enzyme family protein [Alphaproteobacteria bacterium]|nr:formylglycine-generating enzyme family protein [Alphaproteobacteria bacterium]